MSFSDKAGTQFMMGIEYGIIKHRFQSFLTECFGIFFYDITFERTIHHIITGRFRIPDTETTVVFGRQASVTHLSGFRSFGPQPAIQLHRIENGRTRFRIRPVVIHKRRDIEVDKHTELQIDKLLLQSL